MKTPLVNDAGQQFTNKKRENIDESRLEETCQGNSNAKASGKRPAWPVIPLACVLLVVALFAAGFLWGGFFSWQYFRPNAAQSGKQQFAEQDDRVDPMETGWTKERDIHSICVDLTKVKAVADAQQPIVVSVGGDAPADAANIMRGEIVQHFNERGYTAVTIFSPEFYSSDDFDRVWAGETTILARLRGIEPKLRQFVFVTIDLGTPEPSDHTGFTTVNGTASVMWFTDEQTKAVLNAMQNGIGANSRSAIAACSERLANDLGDQLTSFK